MPFENYMNNKHIKKYHMQGCPLLVSTDRNMCMWRHYLKKDNGFLKGPSFHCTPLLPNFTLD